MSENRSSGFGGGPKFKKRASGAKPPRITKHEQWRTRYLRRCFCGSVEGLRWVARELEKPVPNPHGPDYKWTGQWMCNGCRQLILDPSTPS